MKTCKKCKKQAPNNTKICKNCGADLTAVKITPSKKPVKKITVEEVKVKNEIITNPKTEFLYTIDYENAMKNKKQNKEKIEAKKVVNITEKKKTTKIIKEKITAMKLEKEKPKEEIKKQLVELFDSDYDLDSDIPDLLFAKKFKLQKKNKTKTLKVKEQTLNLKNKLNSIKLKKINLKEIKIKDVFKKEKNKSTKKKNKTKKIKVKQIKKPIEIKLTKAQQLKLAKKKLIKRNILKYVLILLIIGFIGYAGYRMASKHINLGIVLTEGERNQVFEIGEKLTYKKISYTVKSVETSNGTDYKRPKEGNQFLIITINFENNSDSKYRYSSEDWKMINSLKEEKSRIISPINAGKALYSGELVVGATKTASLVFEQPIDDEKLEIRYYDAAEIKKYLDNKEKAEQKLELEKQEHPENFTEDLEIDKNKPDENYPKPIFRVKIKVK